MPEINQYYNPSLTLPDLLKRGAFFSETFQVGYLDEKATLTVQTYAQLYNEATILAMGLVNEGLKPGDKLIIATTSNKETITLLWACFLCGIIPTILQPPPTFEGYNPPVIKLMKVHEQLQQPYVFMSSIPAVNNLPVTIKCVDQLDCIGELPQINIKPEDIAFIQFSSGSTGDPKGIILTHFNIMVNLDAIRIGLNLHNHDIIANWMPLFHDMGFIGYHLTPLYTLNTQYHIETIDFIKNPGLWLDMLSTLKVKVTGCPNFGLALTLRFLKRMKTKPQWDFSSMEALLNGAEPISVQIMNDFIDALKPFNFRPAAMMPVYGLAEATLAATFTPLMQPSVITPFNAVSLDRDGWAIEVEINHPDARLISSVGVALNDISILVADGNNNPVPEGKTGIIHIQGESVTSGYYNRTEETRNAFNGNWFNTGDIGFLYKGYYYISGRDKDIIFKNGRHYFANDLEELAFSIEGVSYGKICFAGITNHQTGHEKVFAFLAGSPGEKAQETFQQLRNLLRRTLGITLDELVMIRSNEIPKTSSGKLQRYKLIERYLAKEFESTTLVM